ncbi:MAG TPA: hypothetical protein VH593_04130 [Ktedonobacteraceae bacterium]
MLKQLVRKEALSRSLASTILVCLVIFFLVGCNSNTPTSSTTNGHPGQGSTSSSIQSNGQNSNSGNGSTSSSGNQGNGSNGSGNTTQPSPPLTATADPSTVQRGGQVTIKGSGFQPGISYEVSIGTQAVENVGGGVQTTTDAQGNFSVTLTIASQADLGSTQINVTRTDGSDASGANLHVPNGLTISQ